MGGTIPNSDEILRWLTTAFDPERRNDEGSFEPRSLPVAALDLEELSGEARRLADAVSNLVAGQPSADELETMLVEAEVGLEHLLSHWHSLLEQLGLELFAPFSKADLGIGAASDSDE